MDSETLGVIKEQLRYLTQEIHEIKMDVKNLNGWKFRAIGAVAVIVCLIEIARAGILK